MPLGKIGAEARSSLERISHQKTRDGTRYELLIILMGDPAVEVLKMAKKAGVDLIVMATHARKGFERFVLGSVA